MVAVDEAELAARLLFDRIADSFAVGPPQPLLVIERTLFAVHVLAGGDADSRQQRIRSDCLANTGTKIGDRVWIVSVLRDIVFALGAPHEDIPGVPVDVDAAVLRVLHHLAPEADLVV